ncbi:DUF881 domain-containing protein [Natronincola ferrireducens]|uniref:DUF881 domain-containing protein n=1 Tax=Natronincola ferrireducens TaxID=393762 RepID=UPI0015A1AE68|nr:DUF881 domain-containing protein [Natronincola ferrireducens]
MKKTHVSVILFLLFAVFGMVIGIHIEMIDKIENQLPFSPGIETQEIADLRKANQDMKKRIKQLKSQVTIYEDEKTVENIVLQNLSSKVNEYKLLAGHQIVAGPGMIITLASTLDENIAMIVEQKRYLINLVNELRMAGAEVISINNHRITSRSEITLAGNHINANMTPMAPPYVIRAIGDIDDFQRYITYRTLLFELMEVDGINTSVEFADEVKIPALTKEKPMEFFQIIEDTQ